MKSRVWCLHTWKTETKVRTHSYSHIFQIFYFQLHLCECEILWHVLHHNGFPEWLWIRKRWTLQSSKCIQNLFSIQEICTNCVNLCVSHGKNDGWKSIRRVKFRWVWGKKSPHSCLVYLRNSLHLARNKNKSTYSTTALHCMAEWCGIPCEPAKTTRVMNMTWLHVTFYTLASVRFYYYRFWCIEIETKMPLLCEFNFRPRTRNIVISGCGLGWRVWVVWALSRQEVCLGMCEHEYTCSMLMLNALISS